MRSRIVQADESVGDGIRRRGRSGIRQRPSMVQGFVTVHPAVGAPAAIRHVLWHVQRVHRHYRH